MTTLPPGWTTAALGDLGDEVRISVRPEPNTEYELWSVPAFAAGSPEAVVGQEIGSVKRAVEPGDVLLCKINPRINRVWIVGARRGRVQIASPEYLILRTSEPVLSQYLRWYLTSPRFRDWITLSVEGATGSHTRAKSGPILRQPVPLPPLAEQQRIVAAIEEQLSRVDAAEANLARSGSSLRALRYRTINDLCRLPAEHVEIGSLIEAGRKIAYGVLQPGSHVADGVPLVRVGDIDDFRLSGALKLIDSGIANRYPRTTLRGGEVLLTIVGTIGRTAVAPPEMAGANVARAVAVIPFVSDVDPRYAALVLGAPASVARLTAAAHEVARKTLNLEDVRRCAIPLPSRDEQRAAVRNADAALSTISALEGAVEHAAVRAAALRRSALMRAFHGELVPQDPRDEPASVLLERIATERAASAKQAQKRRDRAAA